MLAVPRNTGPATPCLMLPNEGKSVNDVEWIEWVARNYNNAVPSKKLVMRMLERGFDLSYSLDLFDKAVRGPSEKASRHRVAFVELQRHLSSAEVEELATACEGARTHPGRIGGGAEVPRIRSASVMWLEHTRANDGLIHRVEAAIRKSNREAFGFVLSDTVSLSQISTYGPGDHYDYHTDTGAGRSANRKLTAVVQLSHPHEYVGGELELLAAHVPVTACRERGSVIIFPSYVLHRVKPIVTGCRKSLTCWAVGPPFV